MLNGFHEEKEYDEVFRSERAPTLDRNLDIKERKGKEVTQAFEMWTWRRMERIPWKDRVINEEVLGRAEEITIASGIIKSSKRNLLGHCIRQT